MRRALVFLLGALGARDALGLFGPKRGPGAPPALAHASVVASTEMVRARPHQDAKLARDGDFAKAESIAFMDEAIDGELKLFSVADREF